jgi:hypothetical protein
MTQLWDGIGNAQLFDRGKYFTDGFNGLVEVRRTLAKATRASGLAFIVEMVVVETNLPEKHPVGWTGSWFQKMTDKDVAFSAILAWAAAMCGFSVTQRQEIDQQLKPHLQEIMTNATNNPETNPFVGKRVRLECTQKKTKNDRDFTRYDFSPA